MTNQNTSPGTTKAERAVKQQAENARRLRGMPYADVETEAAYYHAAAQALTRDLQFHQADDVQAETIRLMINDCYLKRDAARAELQHKTKPAGHGGAVSPEFLQNLKELVSLDDLIGGCVQLRSHGRGLVGLCPFHEDSTPSFHVYADGHFKCYGCGAYGDHFDFLERKENLSFIEAAKQLAERAHLEWPSKKPTKQKTKRPATKPDTGSDEDAKPRAHQVSTDEYIAALADLDFNFRMNLVNDDVEVNGEPITDPLAATIRAKLRDRGFPHVRIAEDAYLAEARKNSYHPVRQYLEGLHHDGGDHIEKLAACLVDRYGVVFTFLLRWLIGAAKKVLEGTQNPMLVFDGPQGIGKSRLARWLCPLPAYFIEAPIDPDDKDSYVRLMSKWIWEVAELGATTRRSDREALKHFISMREVTARKAFARYDTRKLAMASLIGTVNNENGFLADPTGNRRFLICRLESIDWNYTQLDVNQVWAQAVALARAGESHELSLAEREISSAINQAYEVDDPIEGMLKRIFQIDPDTKDWISTAEILEKLEAKGLRGTTRANAMALASTMTRLHLEKIRGENLQGQRVWGYQGISRL